MGFHQAGKGTGQPMRGRTAAVLRGQGTRTSMTDLYIEDTIGYLSALQ